MSDSLWPYELYSPPGSSVHGIFQQEYWSGLPFPPPGDLPNPGSKPMPLMSPALAGGFFTTSTTREAPMYVWLSITESLCCTEEINNFTYFCMMVNSIQPNVLTQALEKNESSLVCTGRGSYGPVIWEEEEVIQLEWGAHFHPGNLAHQHRKWNFPSDWSLNAQSARYWVIVLR